MPFFCYQKGPSTLGMEILSNTKNSRPFYLKAAEDLVWNIKMRRRTNSFSNHECTNCLI